ncbi:hypothetical protein B0T26DRAFT_696921 [Lasiosphaeria miniovina]|uniref:Secreted protein n=1 Tax=Lasiosphaeria miniovina TaxID=1954250 RepID=A0AA40B5L2_9PEZI|nr:uncharacterized protein B0T26DRAFT_696921 [Lasiosphaeria miniovina]KAK0728126.1 hypothetical protein B0T26DRAFT_696921 [Lasiosphaeria miniovina]
MSWPRIVLFVCRRWLTPSLLTCLNENICCFKPLFGLIVVKTGAHISLGNCVETNKMSSSLDYTKTRLPILTAFFSARTQTEPCPFVLVCPGLLFDEASVKNHFP